MGFLRDFRPPVVPYMGGQGRHEHQGLAEIPSDSLSIGLHPPQGIFLEGPHSVGEETAGLKEVVDDHRHEDIELEVALARRETDCRVIPQNLHGDHGEGLALGGVHLAGHDGAPRFVLGKNDLAEAAPGTGGEPADVVGNLHQVRRQGLQPAGEKNQLVLARQGMKLVRGGAEFLSREEGYFLRRGPAEIRMGIQPGPHGCSAEGEVLQKFDGAPDHLSVPFEHADPTADLLPKGERGGVLKVGPADFHYMGELLRLFCQSTPENFQGGKKVVLHCSDGGDVHGCREGIV